MTFVKYPAYIKTRDVKDIVEQVEGQVIEYIKEYMHEFEKEIGVTTFPLSAFWDDIHEKYSRRISDG